MAAYNRVSLNALVTQATSRVGDNSVFWGFTEKQSAINEALRVWGVMTGQWSRRFGLPTIAGQIFYNVPKQVVSLQRIRYGSTPLYLTSIPELDYGISDWQSAPSGTPTLWAPIGLDKFAIYPPALAGGSLSLEGIALTPALNVGGDLIDIGDEELTKILDYAHHYLAFKEGGIEFEATLPLLAGFIQAAALRNQRLLATGLLKAYLGIDKAPEQRPVRTPDGAIGARG